LLTLVVSPYSFAQTAATGSSNERLPTTIAENTVPANLTVTRDAASVSGNDTGATAQHTYTPTTAPNGAVTADASGVPGAAAANLPAGTFPPNATMMTMPPGGPSSEVKAEIQELRNGTPAERRLYAQAAAAFPHFCQDWQRMLRDREQNNLSSLNWQEKSGYETASYVGYGPIKTCECKESAEGIPLGKVTYDEQNYYLAGKTMDEAKHTPPKVVGITHTLEIFSWDKNKWFY
jgi:hypothetical protein